eukprot:comp21192_c0_seq2/m.28774 comp21192_c0_seq2/g.28774  ORF comp21192_c0_seq2/g.28774 comp21192_c0_seq2/m.28774 type:complete len:243 (-) comp21192_c0_seq2:137-865(-)
MSRRRSGLLCAGTGPVACVVHSLALEVRHAVSPRYVQRTQRAGGVDDLQRDNVVSWLLALNAHMSFSEQTFFLAVNYLDRFLSAVKVRSGHLQLLMAVCFLLASKVQEESDEQPTLAELVRVSNYAYGVSDLLRMETIVCEKLNWEFSSVTPLNFLHQFVELTQVAGTLSRKKLDHILKVNKHAYCVCRHVWDVQNNRHRSSHVQGEKIICRLRGFSVVLVGIVVLHSSVSFLDGSCVTEHW